MKVTKSELVDAVVAVIRNLATTDSAAFLQRHRWRSKYIESLALDPMAQHGLVRGRDEQLGFYVREHDKLSLEMKLGELAELLTTTQS